MTDPLIAKLQRLENTLSKKHKRYQADQKELEILKSQILSGDPDHRQLRELLAKREEQHLSCLQDNSTLKEEHEQFQAQHQSLIEAYQELQEQQVLLIENYEDLAAENQKLHEKNRIANDHAKVVIERLTALDKGR